MLGNRKQPTIVILKDGSDTSQGKGQILTNIKACEAVGDTLRVTLGPRGMDILITDDKKKTTISNDGATLIQLLDIVHPAAKSLVDIARAQDTEIGDGTTSVVVLATEFLKQAKPFIESGTHPRLIVKSYRRALRECLKKLNELKITPEQTEGEAWSQHLKALAGTAMNSKLISGCKDHFSKLVVDTIFSIGAENSLDNLGIKQVLGGSLQESELVNGVAFEKTFWYAGFGQLPKKIVNPKICILKMELEWKKERDNAQIRIDDMKSFDEIVNAEYRLLYDKLDKIIEAGANVVLSSSSIGDLATQYFAERNIFCAGRVPTDDLQRLATATNALIHSSVYDITSNGLGHCDLFEEKQVGALRYNYFTGVPLKTAATLIIRGGAAQLIEEAQRSLHDAIMVVKRAALNPSIVAGGGAIEAELHRHIKNLSKTVKGKELFLLEAFAEALLIIPKQLSDNAGFDTSLIVNKLIEKHYSQSNWYGIDIEEEDLCDCYEKHIWEPVLIKHNALASAVEAACTILSVDDTIVMPQGDRDALEEGKQKTQDMRNRMAAAGIGPMAGMQSFQGRGGR